MKRRRAVCLHSYTMLPGNILVMQEWTKPENQINMNAVAINNDNLPFGFNMNDKPLDEKVREIIAGQFDINIEAITPVTSIFNLTKDSLDIVEAVLALEREFNVKIEDEDLEKLGKIGDLTNYIREKLLCCP